MVCATEAYQVIGLIGTAKGCKRLSAHVAGAVRGCQVMGCHGLSRAVSQREAVGFRHLCRIPVLEFQGLEFQNQVGELEFQGL